MVAERSRSVRTSLNACGFGDPGKKVVPVSGVIDLFYIGKAFVEVNDCFFYILHIPVIGLIIQKRSIVMRYPVLSALGVLAFLSGSAPVANAAVLYSNDFTSGAGIEWSNNATALSNGEYFLGSSANGFGALNNSLSLSSLPTHSSITVNFDLYIIHSWDGNGPNGGGTDNWQFTADGQTLLYTNFANYTQSNTQAYPDQLPPYGTGGAYAPHTGAFEVGHLGNTAVDWDDATYRLTFTFNHSAPTLNLVFSSFQNQGSEDEGWGLDNVMVTSSVPEPASLLLFSFGALGIFGYRRRNALSKG